MVNSLEHVSAPLSAPSQSLRTSLVMRCFSRVNPDGHIGEILAVVLNSDYELKGLIEPTARSLRHLSNKDFIAILNLRELLQWYKFLSREQLASLRAPHGFTPVSSSWSGKRIMDSMNEHTCTSFGRAVTNEPVRVIFDSVRDSPNSVPDRNGFDPLRPLDNETKVRIVHEWQQQMCTTAIMLRPCACCAIRTTQEDHKLVSGFDVPLSLLQNDELSESQRPVDYNLAAYSNAILCAAGLENPQILGGMRLCWACLTALAQRTRPKFALSNWLYYGFNSLPINVKVSFSESSVFERTLIARAKTNSVICRFNNNSLDFSGDEHGADTQGALSKARKGVRGNVIVSPLNTIQMNSVIPPNKDSVRDTLCAVFVGTHMPTAATIERYKPILVRRTRVKIMIEFLLSSNEHYHSDESFQFHPANLALLPSDESNYPILPFVHMGVIKANEAIEVSTSDYTDRNTVPDDADDELLMENVGYTDGDDTPANYHRMKVVALDHCISGRPYVAAGKGSVPVQDFNNPSILTWLFPHLDPWGIGGFHHPKRKPAISMEEQVCHLLKVHESPFEKDPQFAFVFYNVIRKATVSRSLRFTVPYRVHRSVIQSLLSLNPETLEKLKQKCEENPFYRADNEEERRAFKLLGSLGMVARHVPGSDGYKLGMRNEIRALINKLGLPIFFITINPSDVDHPIVRLYSGEQINLEDLNRGEGITEWRRKLQAARNPAACALFFDLMLRRFISIILGYGAEQPGVYGRCIGYYGTVEAQGKGTLHCHMLIWLEGHLRLQELREKLIENSDYREKYLVWLESVVRCEFPLQTALNTSDTDGKYSLRTKAKDRGEPHPGVVSAPLARAFGETDQFLDQFYLFVDRLLSEYHWHEHHATCWKHLKPGQERTDKNCRMGMDNCVQEHTEVDPITSDILFRRLHPKIASYTDVCVFCTQSNCHIKHIGSSEEAKSYVYYSTDYMTKFLIPVHVGMAALLHALQLNTKAQTVDNSLPDVSAVIKMVNSMMGKQEISHQQVMSYLIGGGDHYTSHRFQIVHWWSICKYVERQEDNIKQTEYELPSHNESQSDDPQGGEGPVATVGLTLGDQEIHASSQVLDYIFRSSSSSFGDLCVYDFFSRTTKVKLPAEKGRTYMARFISDDHPQFETHGLTARKIELVPVLLGPACPNPEKSPEAEEDWARHMLILFKPWRDLADLKSDHETWIEAYSRGVFQFSTRVKDLIKNMTCLAECRAACDTLSLGGVSNQQTVGEHIDNILDDDINHEWSGETELDLELQDSQDQDEISPNWIDKQLDDLTMQPTSRYLAKCFEENNAQNDVQPLQLSPALGEATVLERDECAALQIEMTAMKKRKKRTFIQDDEPPTKEMRFTEPFSEIAVLQDGSWNMRCSSQERDIVLDVIHKMNLIGNPEQLLAFRIVAQKVVCGGDQLLMYVSGVGGTGKSHLIRAIILLFESLGKIRKLKLGAPTGIAAVLIGGQTLHSLIMMNPKGRSSNVTALESIWKFASCLIVDEISMVDAAFLCRLSDTIKLARGFDSSLSGSMFGGLDVIFMGDFGQLKPPVRDSLFSGRIINNPSFREASSPGAVSAINGIHLWRQVSIVVELVRNERQSSDPTYAEFLLRLRSRRCIFDYQTGTMADFDYLQPRLLQRLSEIPHERKKFESAPIVVGTRILRDILNKKYLVRWAEKLGQKVHVYYSVDIINKAVVLGKLQRKLWNLHSACTDDSFGRLSLFPGMKVMVTENLAFDCKIVNGTEGTVHSIKYTTDERGRRFLKVVYVHVPGCGLDLDGHGRDIVPIFPSSVGLKMKRSVARMLGIPRFQRKQVPLIPAYCYTDYKSQGRTVERIVADIASARGQGIYVMLSRVKSLEGLAILRPFSPHRIYDRPSQELREELTRLNTLTTRTKEIFGVRT